MGGARTDELAAFALLEGAEPEQLAELAELLQPLSAGPGDVLVREGEPATSFVLLTAGTAAVSRGGEVLAELAPGMILGELALLRGAPRAATVTATAPVTGWSGDARAFAALLEVPGAAERLALTARRRVAALVTPVPVRLRDGTALLLRPVLPGDRERAAESLAGFSRETLYQRFHSGALTQRMLDYLIAVDYVDHFVWVALEREDGVSVADVRFVRDRSDPTTAEIAFAVGDALQGRGLGTVLVGALAVAAGEAGVTTFTARTLVGNAGALALLERAGAQRGDPGRWSPDEPGVLLVTLPVPDPAGLLPDPALVPALRDAVRQVVRLTG